MPGAPDFCHNLAVPARREDSEVEVLADAVRHHRRLYYNGEPELSDEAFDALEERLRQLDPDHPVLSEVGAAPEPSAPLPEVETTPSANDALSAEALSDAASELRAATIAAYDGGPVDARAYRIRFLALARAHPDHPVFAEVVPARGLEWPKAAHEIPMGSLNKVNSETELSDWAARCDELAVAAGLPPVSPSLVVTEKLDGISIELLYDGGRLEAAITRGDGAVGERITPNVLRMKGVPERIGHEGRVSVRGEIILRRSDVGPYEALKRAADPKFEGVKSLRNTASGVARTKLLELLPATRCLSALVYDVEGVDGLESEPSKWAFLAAQGFLLPFAEAGDLDAVRSIYARYAAGARQALDYEIDGLVVRVASLRASDLLGELNGRPRGAVAFKFGNEAQVTPVRAIEWNTGDTGRITPVARVDPVRLAGAEVRQASLHNLGLVRELGIAVGDEVLVSRRNDVIPYVEQVVVSMGGRTEAPTACGSCGGPVEVDGEYLVCPNLACPARRRGRVKTWVKQLGLLDWGEKTLERLFDEGLVEEPADLYRLEPEAITRLHGFGEETARRLLEPLKNKKSIPFPVFVAALGIPAVSRETGKLLAAAGFGSVEAVLEAGPERLAEIEGLGAIKAKKILSGLAERTDEVARLAALGVGPVPPDAGGPLAGLSFCFSGSHRQPRKVLAQRVESLGGTVASGVKKGLSFLVLADANSASSKAEKARKLGTEVLDEDGLDRLIAARSEVTPP